MANVPGVDTLLLSLSKVYLETEASWAQNQAVVETNDIQAKTFDTMLAKQQTLGAEFVQKLTDPDKVYDVKVTWPDFCGLTASDSNSDVCSDLTGTMAEVKEQGYSITSTVEAGFAIEENKLKDSAVNVAKFIKQQSDNAIKRILEKLNVKAVAFLHANIGYNGGGQYPFTAGTFISEVPKTDYNTDLMPKFMLDMVTNKVSSSFVIDGGKLFLPFTNAKLNAQNADGKGDAARAGLFDAQFDIHGFAANSLSDRTFSVAPYSYAFLTKNYYMNRQPVYEDAAGKWVYSFPIPKYGIMVDAFMQRVCVDASKNKYTIKWLYKVHYDFKLNPTGCDQGGGNIVNGIVEYKQVVA